MQAPTLQARLDASAEGDVLDLAPGEHEGPLSIRRRVTLQGHAGTTIWARRGPVVTVNAPGVVLRDLAIEVADAAAQDQDGACALDLRDGPDLKTENVQVVGTVVGAADEEGEWRFDPWWDLGRVVPVPGVPLQKTFPVTVPVPCTVVSAIAGLEVEPQVLSPGSHQLRLRLDPAAAGRGIGGDVALRTRRVARKIRITGQVASAPVPQGPAAAVAGLPRPVPPAPVPAGGSPRVAARGRVRSPGRAAGLALAVVALLLSAWALVPRAGMDSRRWVPLPNPASGGGPVTAVALAADGGALARGGEATIEVFRTRTGESKWRAARHDGPVRALAFSPDGKVLASGGEDLKVILWKAEDGELLRILRGHNDAVLALALSPDGKLLAAGVQDGRIAVWGTETGDLRPLLSRHDGAVRALAFSPDGKQLASGGEDHKIVLWKVETGEPEIFRGFEGTVLSVAVAERGALLAAGLGDGTLRLWEVTDPRPRLTLQGHGGAVRALRFSADGHTLASVGEAAKLELWDLPAGELRRSLAAGAGPATAIALAPEGRVVAWGGRDGRVRVWRSER